MSSSMTYNILGDVEGFQYARDPDSNDYCSSAKSYHHCRRRVWQRSRLNKIMIMTKNRDI